MGQHDRARAKDHVHPAPDRRFLVRVGIWLFVITLAEFLITYIHGQRLIVTSGLFALSALKFAMVAWIFMHLKYDNRFLAFIFAFGVILTGLIVWMLDYLH